MDTELSVALNFVISYLYNKLPRRRVDMFCEELDKGLRRKFEGHWYPEEPFKGSGFRCVRFNGEKLDPVVVEAAKGSGLGVDDVQEFLPKHLTIWVDPGEVSYRIGENAPMKILYRRAAEFVVTGRSEEGPELGVTTPEMGLDQEVQKASFGFNPCAESFRPIENQLSPTHSWAGSTSPAMSSKSTSPVGHYFARHPLSQVPQTFTAATFAQTKFGSTKMKTQAQRPTRLSPTEMPAGVFVSPPGKLVGGRSPVSPVTGAPVWPINKLPVQSGVLPMPSLQQPPLMPAQPFIRQADPRLELMKEQQRIMLMQQQQMQFQRMQEQLEQLGLGQPREQPKEFFIQPEQRSYESIGMQQNKLCNEIAGSANNSIAASLQSLYEQQQKELQQAEIESCSEKPRECQEATKDPFHTEPGPSVFDQLDWTNFVYSKPQLLVAN